MSLLPWLKKSDQVDPADVGSTGGTVLVASEHEEQAAEVNTEELEQGLEEQSEAGHSAIPVEQMVCLIPEKTNQPVLAFPQHMIGSQKRSFCSSWYSKYKLVVAPSGRL